MKKELVPYESSLDMKELGFDEPCFGFYNPTITKDVIINNDSYGGFGLMQDHIVVAPTFSQAFRFFREKYGLFVAPSAISYEGGPHLWFFEINSTTLPFGTDLGVTDDFKTYEEAELACLNKLIEIKKNDK